MLEHSGREVAMLFSCPHATGAVRRSGVAHPINRCGADDKSDAVRPCAGYEWTICKTARIAVRNVPNRDAKRAVSQCETAHFANALNLSARHPEFRAE